MTRVMTFFGAGIYFKMDIKEYSIQQQETIFSIEKKRKIRLGTIIKRK